MMCINNALFMSCDGRGLLWKIYQFTWIILGYIPREWGSVEHLLQDDKCHVLFIKKLLY